MKQPKSVRSAQTLGRVRLSRNFFMREFLYSEIAAIRGFANFPDEPELAIAAGSRLCEELLEPLCSAFGRISVRSGYRSPQVNHYGNTHGLSCANNAHDRARHIWDQRTAEGHMGAMATIVIPWHVDRLENGGTWQSMAWWIHDHLPYSELQFFPKLGAFNIAWHERPARRIYSFVPPRGLLTHPEHPNHEGNHGMFYPGYPAASR